MSITKPKLPTVLTIAGSDPSGGAGIQTDLKTIHALGGYGLSVTTVLTSQNTQSVVSAFTVPAEVVKSQLETLSEDIKIDTIKIGMLGNAEIIDVIASWLEQQTPIPVILDPVIQSSSGKQLLDEKAITQLKQRLLEKTELITPNLPELETLLRVQGLSSTENLETDISKIQAKLIEHNWPSTLLKGGHSKENKATDYLLNGLTDIGKFSSERLSVQHNHGTGCTLSSAIATYRARGEPLQEAINKAKSYLFKALESSERAQPGFVEIGNQIQIDKRHGSLNHFWNQQP